MTESKGPWVNVKQGAKEDTCVVTGAHAFILRVSSVFGLAPLRFKPQDHGYNVSISIPMCIYSYLLKTALVILILLMTISEMDVVSPFNHKTSSLSQAMSYCDTTLFLMLTSIGVYWSPSRMKKMIKLMNIIALVDKGNGGKYSQMRERRLKTVCMFFFFCFTILMIDGIFNKFQTTEMMDYYNICHYVCFVTTSFMAVVLELQFSITAMVVCARLRQVNEALSITASNLEDTSFQVLHPLPSAREAVNRLVILHGRLIDVVQQLEDIYSGCLLISLLSKMFHLVNSPYFVIYDFNSRIFRSAWHHFVIHEIGWYVFHLLMLFMVVEPCHYTTAEGRKTETLVRRMLSTSDRLLSSRLEIFSRQLLLQPLSYKPMGFCTLDRPLIASIFGAVTTYLVILVQFQRNDI